MTSSDVTGPFCARLSMYAELLLMHCLTLACVKAASVLVARAQARMMAHTIESLAHMVQ